MLGLSTTFALEKTRFEWQGISMHRFYPGLEEGPINIAGQWQDGRTCLHVPPRVATRVHVLCLSVIQYFVFCFRFRRAVSLSVLIPEYLEYMYIYFLPSLWDWRNLFPISRCSGYVLPRIDQQPGYAKNTPEYICITSPKPVGFFRTGLPG